MERLFKEFFTGINYWDSKSAVNMWRFFDEQSIDEDLTKLEECGITHLRVFPFWPDFQPLTAMYTPNGIYEFGLNGDHLPDTEAGKAGVSEEMCQRFEIFCRLAVKHNMKLIVAPLTGQMSFGMFVPPALEGRNPITDPLMVKWEIRYLKYFVNRFKDNEAIAAWNPGNEINLMAASGSISSDDFYVWCNTMANVFRTCDKNHPVISGMPSYSVAAGVGNYKDIGELFDGHAVHTYNIFDTPHDKVNSMRSVLDTVFKCRLGEDISKVPTFLEEFGSIGYQNCSQAEESDYYRACLHAILSHGFHGIMWWCAFDQGEFDIVPYDWNNIGSDYGFIDKNGNKKAIAFEQDEFAKLKSVLPKKLPACECDSVIVIPRDDTDDIVPKALTSFVLAKQAGLNPSFTYAVDAIPESKLYIMPSLSSHKPIPKRRLDEILNFVSEGASFYLSLDKALFRNLEAITGVRFFSREAKNVEREVLLSGENLKIVNTVDHEVAAIDAEVIATDNEGKPVFFKKAYGKGFVYFSPLPIEGYLSTCSGVFYNSGTADYSVWYSEFAKDIVSEKIFTADSPYICITEHKNDDGSLYVYAVNYSLNKETAPINIKRGYNVKCIFGNDIAENSLTLEPARASIFLLEKN